MRTTTMRSAPCSKDSGRPIRSRNPAERTGSNASACAAMTVSRGLRRVLAQIGKRAARIVGWSQTPIERGRQGTLKIGAARVSGWMDKSSCIVTRLRLASGSSCSRCTASYVWQQILHGGVI